MVIGKNEEGNDVVEALKTNLPEELCSPEQLKDLYSCIWNIENSYNRQKYRMQSEEFGGYRPILIKQDIYADMWAYNMFGLKIIEKYENLQSSRQSKNGKYIIKENFNKVIGTIKNTLIEYLVTTDEIRKQELLKYMDDFIVRAITYVKIDKRQFKRKKPVNKSAMSYRKTFQVSTTLNGRLKKTKFQRCFHCA